MVYTGKVIGLLELGPTQTIDINFNKNIYFLWSQTNIFDNFPIYNTDGDLDITLELLEKYYNEGFRFFLGFSSSSILQAVLPWFNSHPDAIGVSAISAATYLSVPKNIYRIAPKEIFILQYLVVNILNSIIVSGGRIFYVYTDNDAGNNVKNLLYNLYGEENIITFPIDLTYSNLTKTNIQNFYSDNNITNNDVCLILIFDTTKFQEYVNYFTSDYNIYASQYTFPYIPVINSSNTSLENLFNVISIQNITTSTLQNVSLINLKESYVPQTSDALYLITSLALNQNINYLYSYGTNLQFDENNDIKYASLKQYLYRDSNFVPIKIHTNDPLYGILDFDLIS